MRRFFFLFSLIWLSNYLCAQTKLGLRAGTNPKILTYYQKLNAVVSRQIILDHNITFKNLETFRNNLTLFKDNGIVNIVCLRFPTDTFDTYQADRVPLLDTIDLNSSLLKVGTFLDSLDGVLDYIQIQNEPLGGPGKFINVSKKFHYGYYAIQWLDTLGRFIEHRIDSKGLNIKIISPGFHDVSQSLENNVVQNNFTYIRNLNDTVYANEYTNMPLTRFWYRNLMEISKNYCDLIDIHLNVDNLESLVSSVEAIDSLQVLINPSSITLPFTTLEWSQAEQKDSLIRNTPWMLSFLDSAYQYTVSNTDWISFMDSINYDTSFMHNAFDFLCQNEFAHACYAGLFQFGADIGQQIFSTCALLTNITTGNISPNAPFFNLYKNLQPCNVAGKIKKHENKEHITPFNIYPNPTSGNVIITSNIENIQVHSIEIISTGGQVVKSTDTGFIHSYELQINALPKGLYILKINGQYLHKLIKE